MTALITVLALASAAGVNAYATLFVLGLCVRLDLVALNSDAARFFAEPWVLAVLGALYLVELVADKIPAVDHVWDAVHTFIRPLAGAAAAVAVVGGSKEGWVILAAVLGGATSLLFHGFKATGRVAVTAASGGTLNWVVSIVEDVFAIGASVLALLAPLLAMALVVLMLWWLLRRRRARPG